MAHTNRELIGFSRGISAQSMLLGYRAGAFAMSYRAPLYQWWSPDPRGVLPLDGLRMTRSLRKSVARFSVTFDKAFADVLAQCADPRRRGGWIDTGLRRAYLELHRAGHAHSVETRDDRGDLVGGLFVVNLGGFVSGESMFHRDRDASKVALVSLVARLREREQPVLLDTQWCTEHLSSLGVREVSREDYLRRLAGVIDRPDVW